MVHMDQVTVGSHWDDYTNRVGDIDLVEQMNLVGDAEAQSRVVQADVDTCAHGSFDKTGLEVHDLSDHRRDVDGQDRMWTKQFDLNVHGVDWEDGGPGMVLYEEQGYGNVKDLRSCFQIGLVPPNVMQRHAHW